MPYTPTARRVDELGITRWVWASADLTHAFFLATSTFDFWPGIPIHHSTDLVHWELIGHAVTRQAQVRPGGAEDAFVLFAPTLRYHDGTFFVACTNAAPRDPALGRAGGNVGNFIVHGSDPAAQWSDAAWVDAMAFDPSLTFADGTCYYTRRSFIGVGGEHVG